MAKVKISFGEWLCMFGIVKKSKYQNYKSEYILNVDNVDAVFNMVEEKRLKGPKIRLEVDSVKHSYYRWYVDGGKNVLGEQLVELDMLFEFTKTEDGKVKVVQTCVDYAKCNARAQVEKGIKMDLVKKFGEVE